MTGFLTNDSDAHGFIGLISDKVPNRFKRDSNRRIFVKVKSWQVVRNVALAVSIITISMVAGSISQQKMMFAQYAPPVSHADA